MPNEKQQNRVLTITVLEAMNESIAEQVKELNPLTPDDLEAFGLTISAVTTAIAVLKDYEVLLEDWKRVVGYCYSNFITCNKCVHYITTVGVGSNCNQVRCNPKWAEV